MKKLTLALVLLVGLGLVAASSKAEETPEALMQAGLEALYTKGDAEAAAATFRKVLEQNPSHYGATFQLAMALDRAGKPAEARPLWEKALKMAEGYNDKATVDIVRTRLGTPAPTPEEAMMKVGLEALYTKGDAEAAVATFRKVLEQNPSHYGATFQLAMALDRAGKPAEARPLWEKALKMAEGYNDKATADAARARLAAKP